MNKPFSKALLIFLLSFFMTNPFDYMLLYLTVTPPSQRLIIYYKLYILDSLIIQREPR